MRRSVSALLALAVLAGVVLLATTGSRTVQPVYAEDDEDNSIVGTWIFTAMVNTPPGTPPVAFTTIDAFNPEGTLTLTTSLFNAHTSENPFLPPPIAVDTSDGYGTWEHKGGHDQYAGTFKAFLFAGANTPTSVYGSFFPGQNVGEATVEFVATLRTGEDGDTLRGRYTGQWVNLSGQEVFAGSGPFSGKRLKVEPLAHVCRGHA